MPLGLSAIYLKKKNIPDIDTSYILDETFFPISIVPPIEIVV
tara:strand:- start:616 stop:741 length:126 start_codon:yes stop_codon:yes gene_type:complete